MGLTTPTIVNELPIARSGPFAFNNDESDADAAVQCVGTPGAGKAIYLTSITIAGALTDVAVTVQDEDGTVLFGPIQCQEGGGSILTKDWKYPLKLIDNKALYVFATSSQVFTIYGEYFIGQAPIV